MVDVTVLSTIITINITNINNLPYYCYCYYYYYSLTTFTVPAINI